MARLLLPLLLCASLYAQSFVVAANREFALDKLTRRMVVALYLDKRQAIGGERVVLINLSLDDPIRGSFERRVLGRSRSDLQKYWLRAHFMGHRPPKVVDSEDAAALYIGKIENAIGYMREETAKRYGLKILYRWRD